MSFPKGITLKYFSTFKLWLQIVAQVERFSTIHYRSSVTTEHTLRKIRTGFNITLDGPLELCPEVSQKRWNTSALLMSQYICLLVSTLFFRDEGVKHKSYLLQKQKLSFAIRSTLEVGDRMTYSAATGSKATCTRALKCVHMTIACGISPDPLVATSAMPEWVLFLQ